ncbi:MAG: hypothetical protein KDB53_18905 [Planctomycetes bacterium]|nr:hypothetical protein [Planctomycetota bacterium]
MDKNRNRRYTTALALAEDLARFRNDDPVKARPAGPLVKAARWVQRNPAVAAANAVVFVALHSAAIVFHLQGDVDQKTQERSSVSVELPRLASTVRENSPTDGPASRFRRHIGALEFHANTPHVVGVHSDTVPAGFMRFISAR